MRPALNPGDGLLALSGGVPRRGQLRVFRDPTLPSRWLGQARRRRARRRSQRDVRGPLGQPFRARCRRLAAVRVGACGGLLPRAVDGP